MPVPIPVIVAGVGITGLILWAVSGSSKKGGAYTPPKTDPLKPVINIDPVKPFKPADAPVDVIERIVEENTPIDYVIGTNPKYDYGPGVLAKWWTGSSDMDIMWMLADANSGLKRVNVWRLTYFESDSNKIIKRETVTLPGGSRPETRYWAPGDPGNPAPGYRVSMSYEDWGPSLSPWENGQHVTIPKDWGKESANYV